MSEQYQRGIEMDTTPEVKEAVKVVYLGRLSDFGLGNPEGIPSDLAGKTEAELQEYAESLKEKLVDVTDKEHLACIDGRTVLGNADGSAPVVRLRHVSGTGSNVEIAYNAGSPLVETIDADAPIHEVVEIVDEHVERTTEIKRSAHLGNCGGVGGAKQDNDAIAEKPAILQTTVAVINLPAVSEYLNTSCLDNDPLVEDVRNRARGTAAMLDSKGWVGQKYVEGVEKSNPRGVTDLQTTEGKHHGHGERDILVILGDKTIAEPDHFVYNLSTARELAASLAGQRGQEGYKQAAIADVAKHLATSDRLASPETPIFLLVAA